jgi:putative transposase
MIVTGANIQDRDGLSLLLSSFRKNYPKVTKIWADMGYRSKSLQQEALKTGFELAIVQRHPKWVTNPAQSKDTRAELIIALGLHQEKRGFNVLPRRWVVERTFAWLNKYRRLSKDYEQKITTTNLYIYLAMTNLLLKRLSQATC